MKYATTGLELPLCFFHTHLMNEKKHSLDIYTPPMDPWLDVIHQDDHILVLNKQSGLLSVPGKGAHLSDCLEARAQAHAPEARTVHRLDRDTSGIVIMAMTREAQRHLGLQFERRKTEKTYIARVHGRVKSDQGEIDLPLTCDWPNRPRQMVDYERGKQALTSWIVISREAETTRMRLTPKTGRSHQLRVHMLALGHPIVGDNFYGPDAENHEVGQTIGLAIHRATGQAIGQTAEQIRRLMLHAEALTLHHPDGGHRVTFTSPCPF